MVNKIYIKNEAEIKKMQKAGLILKEALHQVSLSVKPGVKTRELNKIVEDLIVKQGAEPSFKGYRGFPYATCLSVNEEVVHGFPSDRMLKDGDIISIDVGVCWQGYHADAARTYFVGGNIDETTKKLVSTTKQALLNAINLVKDNVFLGDISNVIQKTAENNGFGVVRDLCGHGIGKNLHEEPAVLNFGKKGTGVKLKEGMAIAIEPMLTVGSYEVVLLKDGWTIATKDGKNSAHEEHTIIVTKDGFLMLA